MAKLIPQSSIETLVADLESKVARKHIYADLATMYLDQSNQKSGELIRVTDASDDPDIDSGYGYYDYNGTTVGDLTDYTLVGTGAGGGGGGVALIDGLGTTFNTNKIDLGGGDPITGDRSVVVNAPSTNKLRLTTDTAQTEHKRVHIQQDIVSFFGTGSNESAGNGIETQGNNYPSGLHAGFYVKDLATSFGAGMHAAKDGYLTVFQGALMSKMKGLKYASDFVDIDWATDLAANGLLIPHQKRVQAMIDASAPEYKTWYVNSGYAGGDSNGSPQKPFTSLGAAITAASSSDKIILASGVYFEASFSINKTLFIEGELGKNEALQGTIIGGNIQIDTTSAPVFVSFSNIIFADTYTITKTAGANGFFLIINTSIIASSAIQADYITLESCLSPATSITTETQISIYNSQVVDLQGNGEVFMYSSSLTLGDINVSNNVHLFNCSIDGDITTGNNDLNDTNSVITGVITVGTGTRTSNQQFPEAPIDGNQYARKDAGWEQVAAAEVTQTLTITNANYTAALALNADTTIVEITLDAALTNDWQPATITGWVVGRTYTWMIVKESNNGVDLTTARAVPNVGYDDDINPFANLIDIDTTQKRAVIQAVGFKSTFGQFGDLIITDSGYVE